MRKLILAATTAIAFAAPATAADLPVKAPPLIAAPVYNWTGFYVGLDAGGVWANVDAGTSWNQAAFNAFNQTRNLDTTGFIGGGHIGYNWQLAPSWVVGFEADISWASGSENAIAPNIGFPSGALLANGFTFGRDLNWVGTLRGRIGALLTPAMLVYATGGVAFADSDYRATYRESGGGLWATSFSQTETGWTVGAGVEWMFSPNWRLRAEYLYVDLDNTSSTVNSPSFPTFFAPFNWTNQQLHIGRVGVSYKF